jgi:hypothetical protein
MVLVEGALRRAGVTGGATRDEIRSAMDDLVRSFDAIAVPEHDGIIIRTPGRSVSAGLPAPGTEARIERDTIGAESPR